MFDLRISAGGLARVVEAGRICAAWVLLFAVPGDTAGLVSDRNIYPGSVRNAYIVFVRFLPQ